MANTVEIIEMTRQDGLGPGPLLPSMDRVRYELDRIVRSKTFQRARRLRTLLEYVVCAALEGKTIGQLKTAGDLFGRNADFDPSLDPIVRVQFGRLRRALTTYYASEGKADAVRIEIPSRQYMPVFQETASNGSSSRSAETIPIARNGMKPKSDGAGETVSQDALCSRALIAVLPFANLTGDPAHDSFCYGLTEEITNGLAAGDAVDVVASSSSFQYKDEHFDVREVGRELGASMVLEGSVRVEQGQTRVIAQLARANDGVAIWSDSFDNQMEGSLERQQSIANEVLESLPLSSYGV